MAEARRRVHERFGVTLEPEVQVLGEVSWPEAMATRAVGRTRPAGRARAGASRPRAARSCAAG